MMDASYWTGIPVNPPTSNRPTVSDGSRLNVNSSGVIDLAPSVSLPYATIGTGFDVNSAASLEFLLNQQRLAAASGLSFLPYTTGATYAQVFDGTSNANTLNTHNVLAYSAITGQSAFPGLFYDPGQVVTSQNIASSMQQYRTTAAPTALVVPSFSSAPSSLSGLSASTSTVCNAHVSSASSSYVYQPTVIRQSGSQPITLSDLIEYGIIPFEQHSTEAVSRPSLQHVVNSRSHQVSAQTAHPLDVRNQSVPSQVLQSRPSAAVSQHAHSAVNYMDYKQDIRREVPAQIRVPEPRHHMPAASTLATETRCPPRSTHSQPVTNLTVPGVMPFFRPSVAAPRPVAATSFTPQPVSTMHSIVHNPPAILQSQPTNLTAPAQTANKAQILPPVSSALVWPYMDTSMLVSDSQGQLVVPPAGFTLSLGSGIADMQQESNGTEQVTYEAVSPAADVLPFNFLDSFHFVTTDPSGGIQLGNFLGSTVDTSALFAPVSQPSVAGIPLSSQQHANANETQATNFKANSAMLQNGSTNSAMADDLRANQVEAEKSVKPKTNLGIVLPMSHGREASVTNKSDAVVNDDNEKNQLSTLQSYDYQNSYLSADQQSLYDKSSVPVADGSATGGIVLTNITGNVYVNQYTMLPGGGVQPIDNALLHADLNFPYQTAYTDTSGNEAYIVQQQQQQPASNMSVMVHTDVDEIGHFAVNPASAVTPLPEKPKTIANIMDSYQSPQPLSTINTSFLSQEAVSTPISVVPPVKPSNQFESSFLKFICGHKAETLSSVLNSPIRSRPELPKYIPEVRRARATSVVDTSVADDSSKNGEDIADNVKSGQPESDVQQVTDSSNSATPDNNSSVTTQDTVSTEWPTVTKLPAKFSHKWKNRTSLSNDHPSSAAATANAAVTVTKVTMIDNVKSPGSSSATTPSSAGKSKGNSASSDTTTPSSAGKSKGNSASSGTTTPSSAGKSKGNSASSGTTTPSSAGKSKGNSASSSASSKTKSSSGATAGGLPSGGKNKSVVASSNTKGSKTKSNSDVQWTVSKKSKSSASQQTGLRLVLKAVATEPTGSSKSSAKTS